MACAYWFRFHLHGHKTKRSLASSTVWQIANNVITAPGGKWTVQKEGASGSEEEEEGGGIWQTTITAATNDSDNNSI